MKYLTIAGIGTKFPLSYNFSRAAGVSYGHWYGAMKFEIGDTTDQALTTTVHELALCKESFDRFVYFAGQNILGDDSKKIKIQSYNSYASFLHHLYEFYIGCIKRELRDTSSPKIDISDRIVNSEAEKLLKNKRHAIENDYAPEWGNHISVC